jgi:diaminohydroxyphosphoribosylaminopyrimidine deaminase/5-amino-6-(5-phosphoribosylamino)uracil reductase
VENEAEIPTPARAVLDSKLRFPPDARMLDLPGRSLILCGEGCDGEKIRQLESRGASVKPLPLKDGRIDLEAALRYLAEQQINEVLLECGPTLAGAALEQTLVDELVIYTAPHLMGKDARGLFNLPAITTMAQRIDLRIRDVRMVGEDIRITASL